MNTLKTVFKIIIMIAVSLTTLSGCGGGSGADTAPVTGTVNITPPVQTTATVPAAPTGVTAAGGTNKTTLSWSAVSGATSYTIYWSKATVATATTGTKIATAGTSYIHRGLFPAATYNYRRTTLEKASHQARFPLSPRWWTALLLIRPTAQVATVILRFQS